MNQTTSAPSSTRQPTQDEISQKAKELWETYGRPTGRDEEIWFEAERALQSPSSNPSIQPTKDSSAPAPRSNTPTVSSASSQNPVSSASTSGAVATPKIPAARGGKRRSA